LEAYVYVWGVVKYELIGTLVKIGPKIKIETIVTIIKAGNILRKRDQTNFLKLAEFTKL
jgi:hypothetical protein